VLRFKDASPIEVSKAGIGGNETHINFSHIELCNVEAESSNVQDTKK
jgi:hypothetical protein